MYLGKNIHECLITFLWKSFSCMSLTHSRQPPRRWDYAICWGYKCPKATVPALPLPESPPSPCPPPSLNVHPDVSTSPRTVVTGRWGGRRPGRPVSWRRPRWTHTRKQAVRATLWTPTAPGQRSSGWRRNKGVRAGLRPQSELMSLRHLVVRPSHPALPPAPRSRRASPRWLASLIPETHSPGVCPAFSALTSLNLLWHLKPSKARVGVFWALSSHDHHFPLPPPPPSPRPQVFILCGLLFPCQVPAGCVPSNSGTGTLSPSWTPHLPGHTSRSHVCISSQHFRWSSWPQTVPTRARPLKNSAHCSS